MPYSTLTIDSGDDFAAESLTASAADAAAFGFAQARPAGKTLPIAVAPSTAPPADVKNSRRGIFRSSWAPWQQSQVGSSNFEDANDSLFDRDSMTATFHQKE
jgi:hypothetical protein